MQKKITAQHAPLLPGNVPLLCPRAGGRLAFSARPTGSPPVPRVTFNCCPGFQGHRPPNRLCVLPGGPASPLRPARAGRLSRSVPGGGDAFLLPPETHLPRGSLEGSLTWRPEQPPPQAIEAAGCPSPLGIRTPRPESRSDARRPRLTAGPRPPRQSCAAPRRSCP